MGWWGQPQDDSLNKVVDIIVDRYLIDGVGRDRRLGGACTVHPEGLEGLDRIELLFQEVRPILRVVHSDDGRTDDKLNRPVYNELMND